MKKPKEISFKDKVAYAIEEIFWFPLFYFFMLIVTTYIQVHLIANSGIEGLPYYLLWIAPITWVSGLMLFYVIKMKYDKIL